jgi:hypothetical protein
VRWKSIGIIIELPQGSQLRNAVRCIRVTHEIQDPVGISKNLSNLNDIKCPKPGIGIGSIF